MTYSIVARDPATGTFGVATATGGPCVGALVPHAASGTGAIATQGDTNPLYGYDGLTRLAAGATAEDIVREVVSPDPDRGRRQFLAVGCKGAPAVFSGDSVEAVAGGVVRPDFAVAGNMLANDNVIEAIVRAFDDATGPLDARLVEALTAGEAAGGDKRGTQSAALLVYSTQTYPDFDCRVDLSATPIADLAVVLRANRGGPYAEFRTGRPRRDVAWRSAR